MGKEVYPQLSQIFNQAYSLSRTSWVDAISHLHLIQSLGASIQTKGQQFCIFIFHQLQAASDRPSDHCCLLLLGTSLAQIVSEDLGDVVSTISLPFSTLVTNLFSILSGRNLSLFTSSIKKIALRTPFYWMNMIFDPLQFLKGGSTRKWRKIG